jgi:dTDP-4-amino-4,6-dideoxygalactose transaminase
MNKKQIEKLILVNTPFLPPLEEFYEYLADIWESKWLTNNGKYHRALEQELCEYLDVPNISLFSNGTLALITALQVLNITGEVITTPFSFVATTHALWWNNITPIFVDIESYTFNLDPEKIESAITPATTAILPVHVYGNPCDVHQIQEIADKYGLRVIYDACHTFGVKINNIPVLSFGDLSVMSFHATKVYNTFEGGAIVSHDASIKRRIDQLKNFGFVGETEVVAPGINAKMNEIQAAMGLLQLKYIDRVIEKRKILSQAYQNQLKNVKGISFIEDIPGVKHSYSYFPILVDQELYGRSRDELYEEMKKQNIFGRRYFYPLISQFPTYRGLPSANPQNLPVAEQVTKKVICLPIYPSLEFVTVNFICSLIHGFGVY